MNEAIDELLHVLTKEEEEKGLSFLVSMIVFRGIEADLIHVATSASELFFEPIEARSTTPLGAALQKASALIEDKSLTPSRAYRPLVVLVCDGLPTDEWESTLESFIRSGRTAKCDRMALAVGERLPERAFEMMSKFVEGTGHEVMKAVDASDITRFFKFVTMSVVLTTRSKNPNLIPDHREVEQAVRSLEQIEEEEFQRLVNEMTPLGFTQSSEVSKYIQNHQLWDQYPHISGCARMSLGWDSWRFNGAIAPKYYARLCQVLNLGDKGSGARVVDFTSYASGG